MASRIFIEWSTYSKPWWNRFCLYFEDVATSQSEGQSSWPYFSRKIQSTILITGATFEQK
uniref:Uncharacterized protein n=1 Tax=Lepeophtheirus salmonis TaxID=72036 RepID=A0A0K2TGB9_LEPSM